MDDLERAIDQWGGDDEETRWNALGKIRELGSEYYEQLAAMVADVNQEVLLRAAAVDALSTAGCTHMDSMMLETLKHELQRDMEHFAVGGWEEGDEEADDEAELLFALLEYLKAVKQSQSVTAVVLPALNNPRDGIRSTAIEVLATSAEAAAVPAICQCASDVGRWVRLAAVIALGDLKEERSLAALLRSVADADRQVRYFALKSLAAFGASAASLLLAFSNHSDWEMRQWIVERLGEAGDSLASGRLTEMLSDDVSEVRTAAKWALVAVRQAVSSETGKVQ